MTLEEFKVKFHELRAMGFVPSLRKGPTGIGYTFETMLGIAENNFGFPDIPDIEIKTHRAKSNSMITLFTFNNKAWKVPPLEAVRKYGSHDKANNRLGLYYTMSLKPNSAGLFLNVTDTDISVRHIDGTVVVMWQLSDLADRFRQKLPALILASAFTEERDGKEYFNFYRSQLMRGTTPELLADQFREEHILVDLRLHDKGTRARNHGTGFRTFENVLPKLFNSIIDL